MLRANIVMKGITGRVASHMSMELGHITVRNVVFWEKPSSAVQNLGIDQTFDVVQVLFQVVLHCHL